jgi:hypothetical protein
MIWRRKTGGRRRGSSTNYAAWPTMRNRNYKLSMRN